jgi:hypothetical protein
MSATILSNENQNQTPEQNVNIHRDEMHKLYLTIQSDNPKNLNQWLTSNKNLLDEIIINYPHLYRDKKTYSTSFHYSYCYDVECSTKKELKNEILKFVIDLIYYNIGVNEKNNLFYMAHYLIDRKFKPSFKLLSKNSLNISLTSISDLYYYFLSNGKGKKPNFNEDKINNQEENILNCCCCLEDYNSNNNNLSGCCLNVYICSQCFQNLNPRRCPLCRSSNINLVVNNNNNRLIKFTHNKKTYEFNKYYNFLDYNEFTLIYFGFKEKKIMSFDFNINNIDDMRERYFENAEELIYYYNANTLKNYTNINIDDDILKNLINGCENLSNGSPLMKYLGLIPSIHCNEQDTEANKIYFFDSIVDSDGLQAIMSYNFLEKIAVIDDNDLYISSSDCYIGASGIRSDYFIKEFEGILETDEPHHHIFNLSYI